LTYGVLPSSILPVSNMRKQDVEARARQERIDLGVRVRKLRKERGWKQPVLSDKFWEVERSDDPSKTGPTITATTISKWERGHQGISAYYLTVIARVFGMSVDELRAVPLNEEDYEFLQHAGRSRRRPET